MNFVIATIMTAIVLYGGIRIVNFYRRGYESCRYLLVLIDERTGEGKPKELEVYGIYKVLSKDRLAPKLQVEFGDIQYECPNLGTMRVTEFRNSWTEAVWMKSREFYRGRYVFIERRALEQPAAKEKLAQILDTPQAEVVSKPEGA